MSIGRSAKLHLHEGIVLFERHITIIQYKERASLAELLENIKMLPNIAIYT